MVPNVLRTERKTDKIQDELRKLQVSRDYEIGPSSKLNLT